MASPTESFRFAIRHGENGFLADGDGEWEECLRSLVANSDMRDRVGAAARSHVAAHYSPEARSRELMESLDTARSWRRASGSIDRPGPRLSIAWALQEPIKGSGGYNSILQMARQLARCGHQVSVHLRPSEQLMGAGPAEAAEFIRRHFFDVEAAVHVGYDFGDADLVVATHWTTACVVNDDVSNRYQKAYFVQDFEPWFYPAGADFVAAERTYSFPMLCLTLGPWLARFLRERYGARAQHFDFAFDNAVYVPGERPPSPRRRVAFYARPSTPRRAFALGATALQRLHEADPEVEIVLFGDRDLRRHRVGFPFLEMGILSPEQLADLYRSTTAGLSLSCTNPSFVPFEMLSCGCPVVELRSERLEGLLMHGETAFLAEATPGDLADALLTLLYDDHLRQTIAANGRELVKNWSWERSARQIEQALIAEVERGASERRQSISLPSGSPVRPLRRHDDVAQPHGTAFVGEICGKRVIGQSFVCSEDGLYRVDVKVGTYAGKAHGRIVFRLKAGPDATDSLALANAEAGEVLDNTWLAFRFPPIPDSGLRAFYFTLEVPDGMAGLAPTVYYSDEPFPDGRRYEGNVPTGGSLAFRTFVMPQRYRPVGDGDDDARDRALALAEARLALSQMESEILLSRQQMEPEPADEKAANGNEYVRGRNVSLAGKAWYVVTHRGALGLARETRDYVRWWLIRRS